MSLWQARVVEILAGLLGRDDLIALVAVASISASSGLPVLVDHPSSFARRRRSTTQTRHWAVQLGLGVLFALTLPLIRMDVNSFIYFQF